MKWKWKWKRPAACLLAAAMIFTMPGVPASAVETDVSGVSGSAPAECSCETHCEQGALNPDCPVCAAEDADLSACKGTEQATPLMAAAADEETISGNVTWENRSITTPVTVKGDTTITLKGENTITITETAYTAALDMYSANLTIQGSGSLTVNVPKGKGGIEDGSWSESGDIPPEIILVETSDRNIDYSTYGAKNLLLPKSKTLVYEGRTYKTDADGTCVTRADKELATAKEDSLDCTAIYPSRVGTVSSVIEVNKENNFFDFVDKDIPEELNFEDCLIAGESMTVIFQTGTLTGKEFEVKYIHEAKDKKEARRFEIVPQEIDGITMPEPEVWRPKVGDTYAVFGIQLPKAYICNDSTQTGASWEAFKEAAKYLYEHEDKSFVFIGTLDGIWAKKRWLQIGGKIMLGGYVNFSDTQFHPEGSLIRPHF